MVNKYGIIIHKTFYKKGKRHDYDIYKKDHIYAPKEVINVCNLGYRGKKTDLPEQLSALPCKKKRNLDLSQEEKSITNFTLKRE